MRAAHVASPVRSADVQAGEAYTEPPNVWESRPIAAGCTIASYIRAHQHANQREYFEEA